MRIERVTRSEDETVALAARVGAVMRAGDCVALMGELGSGKTRFVRGMAMGMGMGEAEAHSPTFVLMNVYRGGGRTLAHLDAHRLGPDDDARSLGWDVLLASGAAMAVEWAERVAAALPADRLEVRLEHVSPTQRRVMLEGVGRGWEDRLSAIAKGLESDA